MTALSNITPKQNPLKASTLFGDYLIMLIAPCVMAVWHYGGRALWIVFLSILSALLTDGIASAVLGKPFRIKDLSDIFIGTAIAMMMPAGVPFYVPVSAACFAVAAVKVPFGGATRSPFIPAAAGFAFASVCFKEQVFDFAYKSEGKFLGETSLASLLSHGNSLHINLSTLLDIVIGNVAGPMGTGCGILMVASCIYLFVRRKRALLATAGFIGACIVFAVIFPRINMPAEISSVGILLKAVMTSILLEISSGSLLFAAVFLLTDHATLPKSSINRVIYGIVCGVFCMGMRAVGVYEETVCFAILFANGFRPVFDSAARGLDAVVSKRKGAVKK